MRRVRSEVIARVRESKRQGEDENLFAPELEPDDFDI